MRESLGQDASELRSLVPAVGEELVQEWKHPKQRRHDEDAAVTILDISRMNNGVEQEPYCINENMPLLALDLLARIVAVRIDARPPFSALFTL